MDISSYPYEFFVLRDFIICWSPWHLWNSSETTGTSSNKGASKKKWLIFKNVSKSFKKVRHET